MTFAKPTCALAAYEALDRRSFQGRLLHVLAAVDRKGKIQVEEGEGKKKTVKDEKESKRKAMAGRDFNWSMLYMNVCCPSISWLLYPDSRYTLSRAMQLPLLSRTG